MPPSSWVTGTVPFGADHTQHPAWSRYESLVNEVLGRFAFHALCTYDTRALPASTLEAAATPSISTGASVSTARTTSTRPTSSATREPRRPGHRNGSPPPPSRCTASKT